MAADRFAVDPTTRLLLRDLGISERAVLRRAELPADLFAHDSIGLHPEEYYRLWAAIEAESPTPDLAVVIAQAIPSRCSLHRCSPRCAAPTSPSPAEGSPSTSH